MAAKIPGMRLSSWPTASARGSSATLVTRTRFGWQPKAISNPAIFSVPALLEGVHLSHQKRRLTRLHSPNSWRTSSTAVPTAETSRRSS